MCACCHITRICSRHSCAESSVGQGDLTQTLPSRPPSRGRSRLLTWLPLAIYALAAVAITWPIATQLTTHGLGAAYGDEFERVRLIWWARDALQHGLNPFYQSLLGYPTGFFSAAEWTEPLAYWPATFISIVTGPLAAYNLWILIELTLSGWTMFFLCRAVLSDPTDSAIRLTRWGGALIGGLTFMAYPAVQGHLSGGHIGVLTLYALPIFALALWRILYRNGGALTAIGGALALCITALGSSDQVVFTILPITLFVLIYEALVARIRFWHWRTIRLLILLFGLGGLLLIPFFTPLAIELLNPTRSADLQVGGWITYSADPLSFIAPSPFTPWGKTIAPAYSRIVLGTNSIEGTAYFGAIALILCLIVLVGSRQRLGGFRPTLSAWWWVAIGSAIFALGPFLKWHDQPVIYTLGTTTSYVTLPWAFFQQLPVLGAAHTSGRFNLTTGLAVAVIAAYGAQLLLTRLRFNWLRVIVTILLIGGILFDDQLFFPEPTTDAAIPSYFQTLTGQSNVRAVFDVPWDDPLAAKESLYFQTVHQKPLIAGYVVRQTPVDPAKLNLLQDAILGHLHFGSPADLPANVPVLLHQIGADAVVVHLSYVQDSAATISQITTILGAPVYQDQRIAIFAVNAGTAILNPVRLMQSAPHSDPPPGIGNTIDAYVPPKAPNCRIVRLTSTQSLSTMLAIDGSPVSILDAQATSDRLVWLPTGFHALHTDSALSPAPIDLAENDPSAPDGFVKLVPLGQGLSLQCARIAVIKSNGVPTAQVDLTWHAAQPLNGDYHLFVHLIGADGKIAAQNDRVPGNGQFPTTGWKTDQNWAESFSVSLTGISKGNYQVQAGWYAFPSLQRVPVLDNSSGAADGLITLGNVTVP